jgi:hypothetical protein
MVSLSTVRAQAALPAPMSKPGTSHATTIPAGANLILNSSFEDRSGPAKDGEPWGKGYLDGVARSPFAHWGYSGFWDGGDYDIKLGCDDELLAEFHRVAAELGQIPTWTTPSSSGRNDGSSPDDPPDLLARDSQLEQRANEQVD